MSLQTEHQTVLSRNSTNPQTRVVSVSTQRVESSSPPLPQIHTPDPFLEQELPRSNRFFLPQGVIDTAYMNAKRDRGHYEIRFQEGAKESGTWLVVHKDGNPKRRYVVNAFDWTCTCPYFRSSCFCKHCCMVADELFPEWGFTKDISDSPSHLNK
jgi:SWIM zinc finger